MSKLLEENLKQMENERYDFTTKSGVIVWAYVTEPKKKQEIYKGACGVMLLTTIAVVIDKEDENE